jgi:hypothetical protein
MTFAQFNFMLGLSAAIPVVTGIPALRKNVSAVNCLWLLFVLALATEGAAQILIRNGFKTNLLFAAFCFLDTLVFVLFYRSMLGLSKTVSIALVVLVWLVALIEILTLPAGYNIWSLSAVRLITTVLPLILLYRYSLGQSFDKGTLIVNATLLFYSIANLLYFVFLNLVASEMLLTMIGVHSVTNALCNISFAIGLWKYSS